MVPLSKLIAQASHCIDGTRDFTYCFPHLLTGPMDFLLAFNDAAALVGDMEGQVRTETCPPQLSAPQWETRLSSAYLEPEHGYNEEGIPFTNMTGDFRFVNGEVQVVRLDGVQPYQTYSDEASGLSVRAVFLSHLNQWTVAD